MFSEKVLGFSKEIDAIRSEGLYAFLWHHSKLAQFSRYSLMNFTFFGCLVRGLPLPLGFLNGALFLLCPASEIQTRSKNSKSFRERLIRKKEGAGIALWPTKRPSHSFMQLSYKILFEQNAARLLRIVIHFYIIQHMTNIYHKYDKYRFYSPLYLLFSMQILIV